MALNDPLGDMIARIHNAQMRNKPKVSTPASRLRLSVLDVLKSEGYIRGYTSVEHASGLGVALALDGGDRIFFRQQPSISALGEYAY